MVIIRVWQGIVSVHNIFHMKVMKVGLHEVIGTDVVEISQLLSGILAQTKYDDLRHLKVDPKLLEHLAEACATADSSSIALEKSHY